jgi:hypothetical protein
MLHDVRDWCQIAPLSHPRIPMNHMRAANSSVQLIAAERQYATRFPATGFICDRAKCNDRSGGHFRVAKSPITDTRNPEIPLRLSDQRKGTLCCEKPPSVTEGIEESGSLRVKKRLAWTSLARFCLDPMTTQVCSKIGTSTLLIRENP